MSQKLVYQLIKELGGTAFPKQIIELAKKRYPDSKLYAYIYTRLQSLAKWGYIRKNPDGSWSIMAELPC
ncbi:MAG: hypothetical protein QXD82_00095 [Nitrososphaerales archaeon]